MGDDTWNSLFPNNINETWYIIFNSWPYPSFDVWDLHTVDRGVVEHLFPVIDRGNYTFCIAHFLGVDHAGHRYGPGHLAMGDKLAEMNGIITKILNVISDDTLVVIIGDHGMDKKGG
jgi:phosphatidylinositol glycan class O